METECGIVKEVKGSHVLLVSDPVSFCTSCSNHECAMRQSADRELWIENILDAEVGDRVYFEMPSRGVILSAMVLYALPIVFLIGGIIVGSVLPLPLFNDKEVWAIVTGAGFFLLSFIFMRLLSRYITVKKIAQPVMIKVEKRL